MAIKKATAKPATAASAGKEQVPSIARNVIFHDGIKKYAAIITDVVDNNTVGLRVLAPDTSGHSLVPYHSNVPKRTEDNSGGKSWDWPERV